MHRNVSTVYTLTLRQLINLTPIKDYYFQNLNLEFFSTSDYSQYHLKSFFWSAEQKFYPEIIKMVYIEKPLDTCQY